jgi:hypothetical protein
VRYIRRVAGLQPTAAGARPIAVRAFFVLAVFVLALLAVWGFPRLDRALNPGAADPGLISFLGTGLAVLALTAVLLFAGVGRILPKTRLFLAAALGYNALLIAVKFSLSPAVVYVAQPYVSPGLNFDLESPLTYPSIAAIAAILYGLAFFALYAMFRLGLQRRLGVKVAFEKRFVQLLVVMFMLAVVGGVSAVGLLGFIEYTLTVVIVASSVLGALIAVALLGAVILCSFAFKEASDQAVLFRNVSVLSTFAWTGLSFIAAYHILWLVFLLTLISLWPLRVIISPPAGK